MSLNLPPETLELCYKHSSVFNKTFLPDAFNTEYSILHKQILAAIDSGQQKVVIAAPRGLGKTTMAKALVTKAILFREYEFISYVSNSETVAEMQTENIKRELRSNREIKKVFGDIAINVDDPEIDNTFSKRSWVAFGNTFVIPRGAGQQVRGLLFKNYRPQLIIVDDLEKRDEMENPENRRKVKEWFRADLEKSVDRYSKKWRLLYIDTLKHHDSLMQELLDSSDWFTLRLELCDDEYNSYVPAYMSTEEIKAEAEAHRKIGQLDVFYMEYRNLPVSKEDQSFKSEYFRYYDERDLDHKNIENIIIGDPAKTATMQSADSAIVGIGVNYHTGQIYIRDIVHGKMLPDQFYDELFAMRSRLKAHVIGVEVTGLEEFIRQPIENEMQKRGPADTCELVWLKARGGADGEKGKILRIRSLVSYYRQGHVFHNPANCTVLETQLTTFPRSKLIDVADATAYIIEMLELGNRYFQSPEEDLADIVDEYEELEYEPALGGEYRRF